MIYVFLAESVESSYKSKLHPILVLFEKNRKSKVGRCQLCTVDHLGISEDLYAVFDSINVKISSLEHTLHSNGSQKVLNA